MKLQHKQTKLENGLTVLTVPMQTESVTVMLQVRVGSRDEDSKVNGISHFLEHMVFKGTKKWPKAMDVNRVIESVGGKFNAFTSREETGFWVKLQKKHIGLGLEFLHQLVFEPLLPSKELEQERGVILEEIKMYEDNPMAKTAREFVSQVYSATCLGQHIIGRPEVIKSVSKKDFDGHLNKWYQPENMVLAVAGGGLEGVSELASGLFQDSRTGKVKFSDRPEEVKIKKDGDRLKVHHKPIQQAHFCLGVETFKQTDEDREGMLILNTILGGNTSSRLWEEVREKRGLVYYVRSSASGHMDTGLLVTQAGCDLNRVEEAIKVVKAEYEKISEVSEDELMRAKEYIKGGLALELEDSQEVASWLGSELLLEGEVKGVKETIEAIEKIRIEDVRRVAERIFKNKLHLTIVGPFKDETKFENLV
jgi:predicted Zn-dependent peptidase